MKGGSFYKGTQWFSINKKTADKLMFFITNNDWYVNLFLKSLIPDELFFHTILFNSELSDRIKAKNNMSESFIRYIDWNSGPDFPRTLNENDFNRMKSSGMFFARKLEKDISLERLKQFF